MHMLIKTGQLKIVNKQVKQDPCDVYLTLVKCFSAHHKLVIYDIIINIASYHLYLLVRDKKKKKVF